MILLAVLFGTVEKAHACDVCNIFEYKPLNTNNYIALFYHYRKFNGYNDLQHPNRFFRKRSEQLHELDGSNLFFEKRHQDYERYQTFALRFNYQLFDKWNVLLIVPYETIEAYYSTVWDVMEPVSDTTMRVSGLGDVITAFDRTISFKTDQRRHIIRPGLVIKWASGRTNYKDPSGILFDPELQAGSGSSDIIFRLNYLNIALQNGFGYAAAVNYKLNTIGAKNYRFGNSWNAQFDLKHVFQLREKQINYIPKVGRYAQGQK